VVHLDASALVSLFMPDRHTAAIRGFLRAGPAAIGVSDFASAEFASVVARRVRKGELTPSQGSHLLNVFDGRAAANAESLEVEPADLRVASTFVRRFELGSKTPDSLHVAVCQRLGSPLLTFDGRQAGAAERLGVRRAPVGSGGA
jgi:uncharacterized protein